ncbi:tryptophan dimethylallyltransferase-domain-containing protein [Mycena filopes]|nr:tryptophan dimethylallyltransferase-domain-containing protein [Mycena filopes]
MSFWWNTVAVPILGFMRRQAYPEDSVQAYTAFLRDEILPLLGPGGQTPPYPSWMTDDHTPVEFSLILGKPTQSSVRFAVETSALPLSGDRSMATLRRTLEGFTRTLKMEPKFDLTWFDICAEEMILSDEQKTVVCEDRPVSETFIAFDCGHYSTTAKVYFMPHIRCLASGETPEQMMKRATDRMGLDKPWAKISQFLSRFLPGDRPPIDIVAIDCIPETRNRLKIYFRTDLASYAQMECFLTLGGVLTDVDAGLRNARLMWDAVTSAGERTERKASYFPAALIYYELKLGSDFPSSKAYLPVRRYLPNDLVIARTVENLGLQLKDGAAVASGYADLVQKTFAHRDLSTRTGIQTYLTCTVKPGASDISIYLNPEAFAPERSAATRGPITTLKHTPLSHGDATTIASIWLREFESLLNGDEGAKFCLAADCCLRDLLVFSPTFRMLEGREAVLRHLPPKGTLHFFGFNIIGGVTFRAVNDQLRLIQGRVRFEDEARTYTVVITLASRGDSSWACWALFSVIDALKQSPSVPTAGADLNTIIIGAGQAGLATAAHLQQLGLRVCIVERSSRVGAPWRDRYDFLQFNTPKEFSHLPYLPFPEDWSMFPSARLVADHLEKYPKVLGLDVRTGMDVTRTAYDACTKTWTVYLRRVDGTETTLTSTHLVVANGVDILGGLKPNIPKLPGLSDFQGPALHSTSLRSVSDWIGKRVVVFGAGCSGHDICAALFKQGTADITMLQRSATAVISREVLLKLFPDLYTGENRPPIDVADQFYLALPTPVSKVLRSAMMKRLAVIDQDLHCNLRKQGFQLPPGESDFIERLTVRRGGFYIDQGCSGLIANGSVRVKPFSSIESLVPDGIRFADGSKLEVDIIVFATGFVPDSKPAAFLDDAIYAKTGSIGGLNKEGEVSGLWCPSGHENLWFAGGDLFNCRFYSRFLALQILQAQ